jgi:ribose transport system substrate-binding protein
MTISGLGPHGEKAVPADKIVLSEAEAAMARAGHFTVAIVLHTTASDWAGEELSGIRASLEASGATIAEIIDCGFSKEAQNAALLRLAASDIHAVISIPIGNSSVARGHRAVSRAGKTLVLLDNAPTGFQPGEDYACLVSADNFGLGAIAAELLSPHLPSEGVCGILTYAADFFATNEREIGFRGWMDRDRPDVTLVRGRFTAVEEAGAAFERLFDQNEDMDGLFVVWDVPARGALEAIKSRGRAMAVTTVDLGNEAVASLIEGSLLKGIAAQLPYEQGKAAGLVTLLGLIGRQPPTWVAMPGLAVRSHDVVTAYRAVWRRPMPARLRSPEE